MTTLPQTTTIRLPRAARQGPLAIAPQVPLGYGQPSGIHMTGGDVFRILRTNLWLIIGLVVLGSIGGYFLNAFLARYHSRYTAVGYIQINTAYYTTDLLNRGVAPVMDSASLSVDQKTQSQLLLQESLISRVLQNSES